MSDIAILTDGINRDVGVFGPPPFIERHYQKGGIWNGNTELPVCMVLYALALANRSKVIVETGVNNAAGATLWLIFAAQSNQGHYHGIELRPECVTKAKEMVEDTLPTSTNHTFYAMDALDTPFHFQPESIDLMFVDDDHRGEHVAKEIEAFWPLIRPGGFMAFHDIIGVHHTDIWPLVAARGGIQLVGHQHHPDKPFGGLGLIQKPCRLDTP